MSDATGLQGTDKYRILSLDGGGSWAVLQVMALRKIFGDITGHQVLRNFQLVAANSGGSITLGGLLLDHPLKDLQEKFYLNLEARQRVFVGLNIFTNPEATVLRQFGLGASYSAHAKLEGLRQLFAGTSDWSGDTALSGLRKDKDWPDIIIAAFDYDRQRGILFRSNRNSLARSPGDTLDPTLAEAVHASSNAPVVYFDAPATFKGRQYWDGGIAGYNNPVLIAVVEALANGAAADDIQALSIGTGTVLLPFDANHDQPPDLVQRPKESAPIADLQELATAIVDDPPDVASFHAHVALGGPMPKLTAAGVARKQAEPASAGSPIVRLNPLIQPVQDARGGWVVPPGLSPLDFKNLLKLPMDAIEQDRVMLIVKLGEAWIAGGVLNQSVRSNRETLACEIGYRRFDDGVAAWKG